jgi:hypothetical protein
MRRLLATLTLGISVLCPVALPVVAQHATVTHQDNQTQTVYITRSGKKYHSDGCRYLAGSKIAISLKDAKAKGYTACKVCHPSEYRPIGYNCVLICQKPGTTRGRKLESEYSADYRKCGRQVPLYRNLRLD